MNQVGGCSWLMTKWEILLNNFKYTTAEWWSVGVPKISLIPGGETVGLKFILIWDLNLNPSWVIFKILNPSVPPPD